MAVSDVFGTEWGYDEVAWEAAEQTTKFAQGRQFYVYGLYESGDPANLKYIGKTYRTLKARLRSHLTPAWRRQTRKDRWIDDVLSSGGLIRIVVLSHADSNDSVYLLEEQFIALWRSISAHLTNFSKGGKGKVVSGWRHSQETRDKMSATAKTRPPKSAEHRANISAAIRGKKLSLEHRLKISAGLLRAAAVALPIHRTDEQKKRNSEAQKRSVAAAAHREVLAEMKRGVPRTIESRKKQSDTLRKKKAGA